MASITRGLAELLPREQVEEATQEQVGQSQLDIYLAGKRTQDARNRSVIWQRNALAGLSAALVAIAFVMALVILRSSGRSHLVPYIVQTDGAGRIVNTEILKDRSADEHFSATKTIKAELASWVQDWRTVSSDEGAVRSLGGRLMAMVAKNSNAETWLVAWFHANNPMERGKQVYVETLVKSIVPVSANTYEVFWQESEMNRASQTAVISHWRNKIELTVNWATAEGEIHRNPCGIFINQSTEAIRH